MGTGASAGSEEVALGVPILGWALSPAPGWSAPGVGAREELKVLVRDHPEPPWRGVMVGCPPASRTRAQEYLRETRGRVQVLKRGAREQKRKSVASKTREAVSWLSLLRWTLAAGECRHPH